MHIFWAKAFSNWVTFFGHSRHHPTMKKSILIIISLEWALIFWNMRVSKSKNETAIKKQLLLYSFLHQEISFLYLHGIYTSDSKILIFHIFAHLVFLFLIRVVTEKNGNKQKNIRSGKYFIADWLFSSWHISFYMNHIASESAFCFIFLIYLFLVGYFIYLAKQNKKNIILKSKCHIFVFHLYEQTRTV
jgi:hypothetical protein